MTITEFLLARIAEDEAVARGWDSDGNARVATLWTGGDPGYTTVASDQRDDVWIADGREIENASHIQVLFDPRRVLAECAAKRRVVEAYRAAEARVRAEDQMPEGNEWTLGRRQGAWDALLALAAVYADHADYDEAWRP